MRIRALPLLLCAALAACAGTPQIQPTAAGPIDVGPGPNLKMEETSTGSLVILPPGYKKGEHYPTLFLLPTADSSAADLFNLNYRAAYADLMKRRKAIIVLPESANGAAEPAEGEEPLDAVERYEQKIQWDIDRWGLHYGVDRQKIIVAGYDSGGDVGWALTQRHPEHYAGAIVMGCRCAERAEDAAQEQIAKGFRYFIGLGQGDDHAHLSGAMAAAARLEAAGVQHQYVMYPGAHVPAPAEVFAKAFDFVLGD